MAKTLLDIKNLITDRIRDVSFSSDYSDEILRAINSALEDINVGEIGDPRHPSIAYEFQKEIQDIPFNPEITGTADAGGSATLLVDASATFITDGISEGDDVKNNTDGSVARVLSVDSETQITTSALKNGTNNTFSSGDSYTISGTGYRIASSWNYKLHYLLRLAADHDTYFGYVSPKDFEQKKYIELSSERIYTIDYVNGINVILINYDTEENLNFVFFSNNMVLDDDGSTRRTYFDGNSNSDTLLMPDRFLNVVVDLALADLYGQLKGYDSNEHLKFLGSGRTRLKAMINAIGIYEDKIQRMKIRSEYQRGFRIIDTN